MRYWLGLCCLLIGLTAFGQEGTLRFAITDSDGYPLYAVLASSNSGFFLGQSNLNGQLELSTSSLHKVDSIIFQLVGFQETRMATENLPLTSSDVIALELSPLTLRLATVAVVGRRNELARELPYLVETIGQEDIDLLQSRNTADAIADLSGVYVQKSQLGGGSPVVRGFEANRVLLVVDGVRMNNAIFRNGHLQNAITVDVNSLSQIELIYGPGSLAYGSDALGGVIHFRTYEPSFQLGASTLKLGGQLGYGTAANNQSTSMQLEYGSERFATYTQLSYARFGDLVAGANRPADFPTFGRRPNYLERINGRDSLRINPNPDRQIGSGYRQYDLLQKVRFLLAEGLELKANFQAGTSSDIPRYDQLIEVRDGALRWAEWYYGPQTRLLGSLRLEDRRGNSKLYDFSSLLFSYQFIAEDRISRRQNDPLLETSEVDVYSMNLQWDLAKSLAVGKRINYGLDGRLDRVVSKASLQNLTDNTLATSGVPTRYPSGGSRLGTLGAFADYRHQVSSALEAQLGMRYSVQWLTATFGAQDPIDWPASYLAGITNRSGAFTTAAGLNYQKANYRVRALFAQGFRAPNIDDFAKFRERNGFIQVPNPELDSERSNSLELGLAIEQKNWSFSATVYHSWLSNAIVRSNFLLPDGSDRFLSFGDTLRVQANINAERARIWGFDLDYRQSIGQHLRLHADFHWLRGRRKQAAPDGVALTLPQDHIPPAYGQASLSYEHEKWMLRLRLRYQFAKALDDYAVGIIEITDPGSYAFERLGTSDNLELTPLDENGNPTGSYAWWTLNLNGNFQLNERLDLQLGVENIFDFHYRPFASGISAPGRNLIIGLNWRH